MVAASVIEGGNRYPHRIVDAAYMGDRKIAGGGVCEMRRRRQHLVNVKENTRSCPIFPTVYCLTRGAMGIILHYHALINIPNHLAMLSPAGPAGHNYSIPTLTSLD